VSRDDVARNKSPLARRRVVAAGVLAGVAFAALGLASARRDPLRALRTAAQWSLQWRGARFVAGAGGRRQSSLNDCGPTALAELLELSGRRVPPADSLRRLSALQPNGTTLGNLGTAAGRMGLPLFAVHWDPGELPLLPLPSLLWVERDHFVVVARRPSPDSVEVHDPAAGLYRMASERFARLWSGEALILLDSISPRRDPPGQPAARPHRPRRTRATMETRMEV
jgi:hypothetical protein